MSLLLYFPIVALLLGLPGFLFAKKELDGAHEVIQLTGSSFRARFLRSVDASDVLPQWSGDLESWHEAAQTG